MKQASPDPGKLFPCQARARGAPGSGPPPLNATPPRLGPGEAGVSAKDNFLVSSLTSTHPATGSEAARGARRGALRCRGRRVGVPRALTSSAIFQTFDPFRKARCSPPRSPFLPGRSEAGASAQPRGAGGPPQPPAARPGHHRGRGGPPAAPPGRRRTPPLPSSRRPAPASFAATHASTPRQPLALSPGPRRRPEFPSGRCSRRHGGLCRCRRRRRRSGCFPRLTLGEVWRCRLDVRRSASLSLPPAGGARRSAAREGAGPGRGGGASASLSSPRASLGLSPAGPNRRVPPSSTASSPRLR